MLLKRVYEGEGKEQKLSHVQVTRKTPVQKFSTKFVEQQAKEGILSLGGGNITLKTDEGDLVYKIVAAPGYYCCHCNEQVGDGKEGEKHVDEKHKGKESPDPNNPAGYRREHSYTCVMDDSDLTHDQAEKMVQKQRKAVIDSIGEKHLEAVQRAVKKQKSDTKTHTTHAKKTHRKESE